jgi:hypothetical protein
MLRKGIWVRLIITKLLLGILEESNSAFGELRIEAEEIPFGRRPKVLTLLGHHTRVALGNDEACQMDSPSSFVAEYVKFRAVQISCKELWYSSR